MSLDLEREMGRRQLLRAAKEFSALGLAIFTGYALIRRGEIISLPKDKDSLIGEDIEGKGPNLYVTDVVGDIDQIPLRKEPFLSDDQIVGWTKRGYEFFAQPEYGVVYPSFESGLGKFEHKGELYGTWYRGVGLPLFENLGGKLIPILGKNGVQRRSGTVHVAGNFLKVAENNQRP